MQEVEEPLLVGRRGRGRESLASGHGGGEGQEDSVVEREGGLEGMRSGGQERQDVALVDKEHRGEVGTDGCSGEGWGRGKGAAQAPMKGGDGRALD